VGNVLVLLSVWRYRPLRRVVNVFVASLAACDLLQTLVVRTLHVQTRTLHVQTRTLHVQTRTLHVQTYVAGHWTLGTRTCAYALLVSNLVILEDVATFRGLPWVED